MADLFTALFAAHLVGDFLLQPDAVIRNKRRPLVLLGHVLLLTALSAAFMGRLHGPILTIIFATHLAMDAAKVYWLKNTLAAFIGDQAVHVAVILGLALVYASGLGGVDVVTVWPQLTGAPREICLAALALLAGIVLCVWVGGVIIRLATAAIAEDIRSDLATGLTNGGLYIGWLERALVLMLALAGELTAIGFLVAAKSILRFGDIQNAHTRKVAEYVIIGTFMSFGWALLVALLTRAAVSPHIDALGLLAP